MEKEYLKITIYEDGQYDIKHITKLLYDKLLDAYNAQGKTVNLIGYDSCWVQLEHSKVILCKKDYLNVVKKKFNLKDSYPWGEDDPRKYGPWYSGDGGVHIVMGEELAKEFEKLFSSEDDYYDKTEISEGVYRYDMYRLTDKLEKFAEEHEKTITLDSAPKKEISDALAHPELYGKKVKVVVGNALSREIERMFGSDIISKKVNDKNSIEYILPYDSRLEYFTRRWKRSYSFVNDSKIGDIIKKTSKGYEIYSHTGKRLSKAYKTKKEAEERLKEIEMFKHMNDSYKGFNIENHNGLYQVWKYNFDGTEEKIAGDFSSIDEAQEWIDAQGEPKAEVKKEKPVIHKYDVYYIDNKTDRTFVEYGVYAKSEDDAKRKVKQMYGKAIFGYPVDAILTDSKKEIKDMDRDQEVRNWLEKYLVKKSDPKNKLGKSYIRALRNDERLPNGVYHKAGSDNSGILHYKGADYYWYIDNNDKVIIEHYIKDSTNRFVGESYFDKDMKGLEDRIESNDLSKIKEWIWAKGQEGHTTRVVDKYTGEVWFFPELKEIEQLEIIVPYEDSVEEDFEEPELDEDTIQVWYVEWFNKDGFKFIGEFDDEESADKYIKEHQDDNHIEMKKREGIKSLKDSNEEIEVEIENKVEDLTNKAYQEYCKCAEASEFNYSEKLTQLLNELSLYTKTTETELLQQFKELHEKEMIKDSKKVKDSSVSKSALEKALRDLLTEYLMKKGYDKKDIDEWLIIRIKDYTNKYGDKGVQIEIANEFVGYYGLPEELRNKMDNIVSPGYFEPYSATIWQAYIWDKTLKDSKKTKDDKLSAIRKQIDGLAEQNHLTSEIYEAVHKAYPDLTKEEMIECLKNSKFPGLRSVDLDGLKKVGFKDGVLPYHVLAWKLNEIMMSMNNEEAYYGAWIYLWPDGETREQCQVDFNTAESYKELQNLFERVYKAYHKDGLYTKNQNIVDYAHKIDKKLGLPEIKNWAETKIENGAKDPYEDDEETKDSSKIMNVYKKCVDILNKHLEEEKIKPEEAEIEVRHENDSGKDQIILNGNPDSWKDSQLEEQVINEIFDLLKKEYHWGLIDFKWSDNSAGGTFTIKE